MVGGIYAKNMKKSTVWLKITRPGRHSMTPLSARSSYDNGNWVNSNRVMELPKVADNSPRFASEKQHGTESENACNFSIFDTFRRYIWKAVAPRSKHSGTPKLELELWRVCTINGSPHPLLVIYTYGSSASDYTCRLNIHYLLYNGASSELQLGLTCITELVESSV